MRHLCISTRVVDGEISLGVLCSPDVVTDLDEKTAEEKEAEANGAEAASANDFLRQDGELPEAYARRVFKRVFCQDIEKVLSMEVCLCCSATERCNASHIPSPVQSEEHHLLLCSLTTNKELLCCIRA